MSEKSLSVATTEIDYSFPKWGKKRWTLACLGCFMVGVIGSFPLFLTLENGLKSTLTSIPGCSISFRELNFHFFLPKLVMTNVVIPSSCVNTQSGDPLELKEVRLNFRGISFAPFGPHFKLETEVFDNPIHAYLTAGPFTQAVNIKENQIDLNKFSALIPQVKLKGKVELNALANFSSGQISELKLAVSSKDFILPGQKIYGFNLPVLSIGDFLIKGKMEKNKRFQLESFILGDTDSPIRSNFSGHIDVSTNYIANSRLNLKGEVAFGQSFLNDFKLIEMAMQRYTNKDGFYQLEIAGQLSNPNVKSR